MSALSQITLLLNDTVVVANVPPGQVALDYLRKECRLTGSKEGCKEGDCGACTVIVGTLKSDEVVYEPMTSCLLPMGELHGKHLVSIEGLNGEHLSPVQESMVKCGGTQCGYCTPGFIVAMTAGLMDSAVPLNKEGCEFAISGNLCRCTGYRSIKTAGIEAVERLKPIIQGKNRVSALCEAGALPRAFESVAEKLKGIPPRKSPPSANSQDPIIAGGTDLYVQQGDSLAEKDVLLLNDSPILPAHEQDGIIHIDARMSFETFGRDATIQSVLPSILDYNDQIASWTIRTRATLAGNICNASPIADITCLLLALDASIVLVNGDHSRSLPLRDLYLGYKKLAKEQDEIVSEVRFQKPTGQEKVNWEKVSKRRVLDIATVNSAIRIETQGTTIKRALLAVGGVAPTPLLLQKTSRFLSGKEIAPDTVFAAADMAQEEFNPISDVRGSAAYKRLLARQLILAHFIKLFPESFNEEALYAAHR